MAIAAPDTLDADRQALAESCFPMAKMLAGQYAHRHELDPDECESVAMYALTSSARTFDHDRGVKFSTLAYNAISRALWQRHRRGELSLFSGLGRSPRRAWRLVEDAHPSRCDESPAEIAIRHETAAAMRDAMPTALTAKQHCYMRRSFSGSPSRAIGSAVGVGGNAVVSAVRHGLLTLRVAEAHPLLFASYLSCVCPACGLTKRASSRLCGECLASLPDCMLKSIATPQSGSYAQAMVDALVHLNTRGPFWPEPATEAAS